MRKETFEKFIKKELEQLDIKENSRAYKFIYDQAIEAAEFMGKRDLRQLIEDHLNLLPQEFFYEWKEK